MDEKVVQGTFMKRQARWTRPALLVGAIVVLCAGGLWGWHVYRAHHLPKPKPASGPVYPVITQDQIKQAHETVAAEGNIQSLSGTALVFMASGSKQAVSLTVTSSTTYLRGVNFAQGKVGDLQAGLHVIVEYNSRTNTVLKVAYGL